MHRYSSVSQITKAESCNIPVALTKVKISFKKPQEFTGFPIKIKSGFAGSMGGDLVLLRAIWRGLSDFQ